MSLYKKSGEIFIPTEETSVVKTLPVGTYVVGFDQMIGFFLKPIDDFKIKGKIYGKVDRQAEKILNTFRSRPSATGVMLNGEKGSGKTLLAKLISQKAYEMNISTIVINTAFSGDTFNTFIQSIDQECIIVFDEFEKIFDLDDQEKVLTLFDGVYPTKKLFIITCNDQYKVNQHMKNRPGRIFYMLDYKGLDKNFIEEYCQDNLNDKTHIDQICRLTMLLEPFNFDMLKALVEEMNRYNETPNQALEMLNAKPSGDSHIMHDVEIFSENQKIDNDNIYPRTIRGIPISREEIEFEISSDNDDELSVSISFGPQHLVKIDPEIGSYTYSMNHEGKAYVALIKRQSYGKQYNWLDAL